MAKAKTSKGAAYQLKLIGRRLEKKSAARSKLNVEIQELRAQCKVVRLDLKTLKAKEREAAKAAAAKAKAKAKKAKGKK